MSKMIASVLTIICLFHSTLTYAQSVSDTSKQSKVLIENADNWINKIVDGVSVQYLRNNVRIIHDSIYMFCDSARLRENELIAVGKVVIIQDDTIHVFSDSLFYNSKNKIGELFYGVVLEHGEKQLFTEYLIYNMEEKKAFFNDTTTLIRGSMTLSSLEGYYDVGHKNAKFYKEVSMIDGDLTLKTDSLLYDTDIDRAYFLGPTFITQGKQNIYCTEGYYDLTVRRAYFSNQPIVKNGDQKTTGENMSYSGKDSLLIITGNAIVEDSTSVAKGRVITMDEKSESILIEGDGYYEKDSRIITGPYIYYNKKNEKLILNGRSLVRGEKGTIEGDSIVYDKSIDFGWASGMAIWRDTVENITVNSDKFEYREKTSYYKAVAENQRPLFSKLIKDDTLYVSADTLLSENIGDSINYVQALRSVKIFKSDLQGVCDSLYYSDLDSIFQMFDSPIAWSDTTQFLGDTISIKISDENVSDIIAHSNAFISSHDFAKYYNQIKGKYVHAYLDSNQLNRMLIRGNAESIYMIKDSDDKYIGPNYTACGNMMFYFLDKELDNIRYFGEPTSQMTPMKKADDSKLFLPDFKWYENERPMDAVSIRNLVTSNASKLNASKIGKDIFEQEVKDVIFKESNKSSSSDNSKKRKGK